jgi:hypothetical protein
MWRGSPPRSGLCAAFCKIVRKQALDVAWRTLIPEAGIPLKAFFSAKIRISDRSEMRRET